MGDKMLYRERLLDVAEKSPATFAVMETYLEPVQDVIPGLSVNRVTAPKLCGEVEQYAQESDDGEAPYVPENPVQTAQLIDHTLYGLRKISGVTRKPYAQWDEYNVTFYRPDDYELRNWAMKEAVETLDEQAATDSANPAAAMCPDPAELVGEH